MQTCSHLARLLSGCVIVTLVACSDNDSGDSVSEAMDGGSVSGAETDAAEQGDSSEGRPEPGDALDDGSLPAAAVGPDAVLNQYGTLLVVDTQGEIDELVAGFFQTALPVTIASLTDVFDPDSSGCLVESDDVIGFDEISAGYIPSPAGVNLSPSSAGQVITLSSPAGSYAELQARVAGGFVFYDVMDESLLPMGVPPDGLIADIAGERFPAFMDIAVPTVEPLVGVTIGNGETDALGVDTRIRWQAGADPDAKIRIFSTTNAGFFTEDGLTVTCLVPDTGEFVFPDQTRSALGADFEGTAPLITRLRANIEQRDDALMIVVRESFR